jgi:pimeloyl-ACP methyl ester carboxylesterase
MGSGEWQAGDVETNGIRLHYTRTGGDKPAVVLAHGLTDDGLCWTPVAEALADAYDVVMVDARGHGRSDAPEQGYGPDEQARDLAGAIAGLGLARPAVLGHSMGAATALVLAGTQPDAVGAILLEDPPAWWMGGAAGSPDADVDRREWMAGLKRATREELLAQQRAETPGWSEAELGPWADAKHRFSCNLIRGFGTPPAAGLDWPATLGRITCPALLITGDPALGAIVTEEDARALGALIPELRVAHMARAGHNIRRDEFDRYLELVSGFLAAATAA